MRLEIHIAPNENDIVENTIAEPDGERIRAELVDFLKRNKIVSIMLDTEEHVVEVNIVKLPPKITPVLTTWGSVFVRDDD